MADSKKKTTKRAASKATKPSSKGARAKDAAKNPGQAEHAHDRHHVDA